MPLDPGAQRVLDLIREVGRPPLHTLSPVEARAASSASRTVLQPDPQEVAEVTNLTCPGPAGPVALRRYRGLGAPVEAPLPCLLYLHGGGWVIGDLDSHDQPCRLLANAARCCVIAVDYRMAPEHVYPAAVEDCAAALRFVAENAGTLRIDPSRIAVGGDSAGGNLAAALAIHARDNGPALRYQLLVYPVTDHSFDRASYVENAEGYLLQRATMQWFWNHYLRTAADGDDWRASPLRARSGRRPWRRRGSAG